MTGMTMAHGSRHAGGLLAPGVAIAWIAVLLGVVVAHCRPLLAARGRTRAWHLLHLAMAIAMALMYASASGLSITVAGPGGTLALAAALAAGLLVADPRDRLSGWLWSLAVLDVIAMGVMMRPAHPVAIVSWLLVAYLAAQALLWTTPFGRRLGERAHVARSAGAGTALAPDARPPSIVGAVPAPPVSHALVLRAAMALMAASMACMLAAMQLAG